MKHITKRICPIIVAPSEQRNAVAHLRRLIRKGLIIFDFETTGLEAKKDHIIQINAIKIKNGKIKDTFGTYVNNKIHIPEEVVMLTGITNDDVMGAPDLTAALKKFSVFASGKGYTLSSYNATFEKSFLGVWDKEKSIPTADISDLLPIAKTILKDKVRTYSLKSLSKYFGIFPDTPCPRLTAEIILAMANDKKL